MGYAENPAILFSSLFSYLFWWWPVHPDLIDETSGAAAESKADILQVLTVQVVVLKIRAGDDAHWLEYV